jgi:hypothetical protein
MACPFHRLQIHAIHVTIMLLIELNDPDSPANAHFLAISALSFIKAMAKRLDGLRWQNIHF